MDLLILFFSISFGCPSKTESLIPLTIPLIILGLSPLVVSGNHSLCPLVAAIFHLVLAYLSCLALTHLLCLSLLISQMSLPLLLTWPSSHTPLLFSMHLTQILIPYPQTLQFYQPFHYTLTFSLGTIAKHPCPP